MNQSTKPTTNDADAKQQPAQPASSNESVFTGLMCDKFIQKDLSLLPDLTQSRCLLADYFVIYTTKNREVGLKVYCELWDGYILIKDSPIKKPIGFMNVSYARLKLGVTEGDMKIRFVKNKKYEELFCDDEAVLRKWFDGLSQFCTYSNFRADFDIVGLLGKGNFAKVYLVEEKKTQKKYAAKIFDKDLIKQDPFELQCFLYEVQMLRKVNGPHLLKTHKLYEGENNIYCVGEHYSGGTLYDHIKQSTKPLPENEALGLLRQVLEGLAHLERLGLIHRDLKPENIMMVNKTSNDLAVVDFGFMTKIKDFRKLFNRCGTPGYVAPEVLADQDYDCSADVYSAGILLYVLLTKQSPYNDKSYTKLVKKNKSGVIDFTPVEKLDLQNKTLSKINTNCSYGAISVHVGERTEGQAIRLRIASACSL